VPPGTDSVGELFACGRANRDDATLLARAAQVPDGGTNGRGIFWAEIIAEYDGKA
jgi:hypothetical protein